MHVLTPYLKQKALVIVIIVAAFFFIFHYSLKAKNDWYIFAVIFISGFIDDYSRYKKRTLSLNELKESKMSEQEFEDAAFIKSWKEKRKVGLWRFILIDGGIVLGIAFLPITCFIVFFLTPMPKQLASFIVTSYLIGALLGVSANLFLWSVNQEKFTRLTNAVH